MNGHLGIADWHRQKGGWRNPCVRYELSPMSRGAHSRLLVRLIMQNKGRLAKNKRDLFSEVTDEELAKIEKAMGEVAE